MPSSNPPTLPPSSEIYSIHDTIHLLYHRNKNQHRPTKWFKSLDILRRTTWKLACAIARVEKRREEDINIIDGDDDEQEAAATKLRAHLGRQVIPRSYRAFSTVVADTQFSALGVVLIALLSRLSKVVGAATYFPQDGDMEEEEPVRGVRTGPATPLVMEKGEPPNNSPAVDLGEVVKRDGHSAGTLSTGSTDTMLGKRSDRAGIADERKKRTEHVPEKEQSDEIPQQAGQDRKSSKKKKRKKNAIDDIFGGL